MAKILTLILLLVSINASCKEENNTKIMSEKFKKMIKKREVSQTEKEKWYYKNQYRKFSNSLIKEQYRQLNEQVYGITKDFNPGDKSTAVSAGNYYIAHTYAINLKMLNGEYTLDSINKVINFWKEKGIYNPKFWINVCKKVGEKDIISNRSQIEKAKRNEAAKGLVLKEYPYWKCKFEKDNPDLIFDF
ncbi:MAG: hypothetical protein QM478_11640 [Flavobacteriaceae bacterium]